MMARRSILTLLPVAAFGGLALIFLKGLSGDPSQLPSTLINKPVPAFSLSALEGSGVPALTSADLTRGNVTVVNIFASWCVPCRQEHPLLMELAQRADVAVMGINYKDDPANARRFLNMLGNPFAAIGADESGMVAIDWGSYGVPETFVVDGKGVIRFKVIGPLSAEIVAKSLLPEIEKARKPVVN